MVTIAVTKHADWLLATLKGAMPVGGGIRGGGGGHKISLIRVSITWMSAEPDARFSPSLSHTD